MKHKAASVCLTAIAILALSAIPGSIRAAATTPGTASDPLVSRSYVDERYNQLLAVINGMGTGSGGGVTMPSPGEVTKEELVAEVMAQLEYYYSAKAGVGAASAAYAPLQLRAGEILVGAEGTELIPRSGTSVAYTSVTDGVSDITIGRDLKSGETLSLNHLLIVPRGDGRGVKAVTNAWFLVRGEYTIQN